ncbi:MAG: HD domain-containing phosphohydrolase [Bdellovibrionales bacterium]
MSNVLLVDDDVRFRDLLKNVVEMLGCLVRAAENGLVAKTIFDLNPSIFTLVIADIQMPELDGFGLLQHIRSKNNQTKFILMTGQKEILEAKFAKQALEAGANEFLSKPFRVEHLKSAISACFDPEAAKPQTTAEPVRFCKIPAEEFITSTKLVTDLYIRISSEKYVKIAYAGTEVPIERLRTYMEKKVDSFHVRPEDLRKLVGLNLKLNKASSEKRIPEPIRLKLLANTAKLITQSYYYEGIDKQSVSNAAQVIDNTLNIITDDENIASLLSFLQTDGDRIYAHSVAVSVYSCLIAKKMGHSSAATQFKISMAGLFHDIGKKELPAELISKSRFEMNSTDVKLYESHPQRGREILSQIPGLPEDVVQVVAHHHETVAGTGFPYRLSGPRIHPLAKILGVADFFITNISRIGSSHPSDVADVLKKLKGSHVFDFDQKVAETLASLFETSAR